WIEKLDEKIRESNRHILLILDGAPSYVTGSLNLTNIKVLMLPLHATSKIQPMDAGIIASFKLHYRYLQLQHAIDRDEDGEKDIYKVDQLQVVSDYLVKPEIRDVGSTQKLYLLMMKTEYLSPHAIVESIDDVKENLPPDPNDELTVKELQQQIDILPVQNPLSIEDLLNLEEE
ncbi:36892_t:CDS:2, partial [Racocetra persica]